MILRLIAGTLITLMVWSGGAFGQDTELATINKAIKAKGAKWTAGETSVSKLSKEARKALCGAIKEPQLEPGITVQPKRALPTTLDWRNVGGTNWTTPIRNQANCGSCVAFGAIGALEPLVRIEVNNPTLPIDLSEQHLFSCGGGDCDWGWYPSMAANYLKYSGTPDETCYPYQSWDGNDYPCLGTCPDWPNRAVKITQWNWVANNVDNIRGALLGTPLSTTMDVYDDFFSYTGGVYEHTWGALAGGHQITFVGYNNTEGYWICKNSWGTGWGEAGWFKIKYNNSGIGDSTILMSGTIIPKTLSLNILLNGGTFTTSNNLFAKAHVTNDATPDEVDVKVWVQLPDSSLLSLLNLPMVTIGANADFDATLLNYTLTGGEPLGNYKIGGRFLSWISGDILCEDIEPFVVR
ncbi:MAG: C1 family peptidase [Nitrospirota bacterium]